MKHHLMIDKEARGFENRKRGGCFLLKKAMEERDGSTRMV